MMNEDLWIQKRLQIKIFILNFVFTNTDMQIKVFSLNHSSPNHEIFAFENDSEIQLLLLES